MLKLKGVFSHIKYGFVCKGTGFAAFDNLTVYRKRPDGI